MKTSDTAARRLREEGILKGLTLLVLALGAAAGSLYRIRIDLTELTGKRSGW